MLPVYICEDDYEILCIQKEYIEKQILINGYDMKIVVCSRHPEEIIEIAKSSTQKMLYSFSFTMIFPTGFLIVRF